MKNWHQRLTFAREKRGIKKSAFAKLVGVSAPAVTDWENGETKKIDGENLVKVCRALNIGADWLLFGSGQALDDDNVIDVAAKFINETGNALLPTVSAIHPDDDHDDDIVYVPESKIEFSAGPGRTASFELIEDHEPATYRLSWFQKYGINPKHVRRFRVSGDSMEPMLFARDTILVNMDEINIVDCKMYAIRYGDELRVKYLSRRLDGTMILRSVNPLYKPEELPPELAGEHITVIGRVRDASGTGGL